MINDIDFCALIPMKEPEYATASLSGHAQSLNLANCLALSAGILEVDVDCTVTYLNDQAIYDVGLALELFFTSLDGLSRSTAEEFNIYLVKDNSASEIMLTFLVNQLQPDFVSSIDIAIVQNLVNQDNSNGNTADIEWDQIYCEIDRALICQVFQLGSCKSPNSYATSVQLLDLNGN